MSVHFIETPKSGVVEPPKRKTFKQKEHEIKQVLDFADFLILRCYFDKAEKLLKQVLKKYPQSASLWSKLGLVYFKQYKGAEAKTAFEKAKHYNPNQADALYHLGEMNKSLMQVDQACRLTRDPYYLGLCNCYFKKLPEAFADFVKAYETNLETSHPALMQFALETVQLYLTAANVASELNFKEAFAGVIEQMNKMIGFANKHFREKSKIKLITKHTSSKKAFARLILAAKSICEAVIKDNRRNESAHYNLGMIYFMQEKYEQARKCFEQVIELNPRHAFAHLQLGLLSLAEEKTEEAEKHFKQAHQLFKEGGQEDVFLEKIEILKGKPEKE